MPKKLKRGEKPEYALYLFEVRIASYPTCEPVHAIACSTLAPLHVMAQIHSTLASRYMVAQRITPLERVVVESRRAVSFVRAYLKNHREFEEHSLRNYFKLPAYGDVPTTIQFMNFVSANPQFKDAQTAICRFNAMRGRGEVYTLL